ncbi:hypothetical protein BN2476_680017 [Paraburkholderia piptadeniae]|uniref:Uncharacterized protein n=1 Tax=Paraburkholderia piptadeniae TaxID=1701573 RepID=A0A1N7SP58_9BURK|nr:hypothetical protein BN2476_680017 [Paraburkholderia piptadeniae]
MGSIVPCSALLVDPVEHWSYQFFLSPCKVSSSQSNGMQVPRQGKPALTTDALDHRLSCANTTKILVN